MLGSVSTDRHWQALGDKDPYYGVLADEKFSGANIAQNRDLFFRTGQTYVTDLLARYEKVFGDLPKERALDFGCGVGRLTLPLARQFGEVVGVDISSAMLNEARHNASLDRAANIKWFLSNEDGLAGIAGDFDFINTYIVLQHIPVSRGLVLLEQLVARLRPGGGLFVHLSVARDETRKQRVLYWLRANVPGVSGLSNLRWGKPFDTPRMQMNEYPLEAVMKLFQRHAVDQVFTMIEPHGNVLTLGLLGRRNG